MKPFGRHNGMRSFPSEERSKPSPEWNQYRVVCSNGVIRLSVNGKEVSGGEECNYRKGYLALESEGAPVEFRNIRIHELPSSNPEADLIAPLDQGWRALFTGLDLRGWKTNATTAATFRLAGEHLAQKAGPGHPAGTLWTETEFGDAQFVVDCRIPKRSEAATADVLAPAFAVRGSFIIKLEGTKLDQYQRITITSKGRELTVQQGEEPAQRLTLPEGSAARGAFGLVDNGAAVEFMNFYARDL